MSAGGGHKGVINAKTICGSVKLRKYGKLFNGMRFPLKLKVAINKSYQRPAILYRSEA